jgi:hypothetical protein
MLKRRIRKQLPARHLSGDLPQGELVPGESASAGPKIFAVGPAIVPRATGGRAGHVASFVYAGPYTLSSKLPSVSWLRVSRQADASRIPAPPAASSAGRKKSGRAFL